VIALGTAFYRREHPYFVISDPASNDGKVLCVNLTTLDEDCIDDECCLDENDYAWIKPNHPTVVAFSRAQVWDSSKIEQCLRDGTLDPVTPPIVPSATIAKVVAIAKVSRELSPDMRKLL
jgi:hypothetical protein